MLYFNKQRDAERHAKTNCGESAKIYYHRIRAKYFYVCGNEPQVEDSDVQLVKNYFVRR